MSLIRLNAGAASAEWCLERGGTLTSLSLAAEGGREREAYPVLWPGLAADEGLSEGPWAHGGMPLLFPFAGRVWWQEKEGFYQAATQVYPMPLHGFAHRLPWQILEQSERRLCLGLTSDHQTLGFFPWHFKVRAVYDLSPSRLQACLDVTNIGYAGEDASDALPMPLAAGFHPYFRMPPEDEQGDGSCLAFDSEEVQFVTQKGAPGAVARGQTVAGRQLSDRALHNLILRKVAGNHITLLQPAYGRLLHIRSHYDDGVFVLWKREQADFFCIEPWMGPPNAVHTGEGLRQLGKGASLSFAFDIASVAPAPPSVHDGRDALLTPQVPSQNLQA